MYGYLTGIIKYKIKSDCCESVINRLRCTIPVYSLKKSDKNCIEFTTGYRYRGSVDDVVRQTGSEIVKAISYGLPALADRYKHRIGMWIGVLLAIVTLLIASEMIWEVRISGNTYVRSEDIALNLKRLGISEGKFINKDVLEGVYNSFLINEPRISWISVNYDGTVAKVMVKETKVVPEKIDRNKNINVVAKCDGVIKRLDVFDGAREVNNGDSVTKGQLLISSFTETRKTGSFMKAARGNAWATTVHNYEIRVRKSASVKSDTVNTVRNNRMEILGIKLPFYIPVQMDVYDNCAVSYDRNRACLFGKFNLPFITETEIVSEFTVNECTLNMDSAGKKAESELVRRIETELSDADIIGRAENFYENDDEYVFCYELTCIENISESIEFEFE